MNARLAVVIAAEKPAQRVYGVFQAVFDVPTSIEKPSLAFDNGILMGDVFDLVAYRRIGVMLY